MISARWTDLLRGDVVTMRRDPLLALCVLAPVLLTGALRFGVPRVTALAAPWVDLAPFHPFMVGAALLLGPAMFGFTIGFMLLEERDERVLDVVAVTPLRTTGFLAYRLALPVAFGFLAGVGMVRGAGLVAVPLPSLVLGAALGALQAPLYAGVLVAFASDKVQGLALSKATNIGMLAPLTLVALSGPWRFIGGISPTFWPVYVMLSEGPARLGGFAVGLALTGAAVAALAAQLRRRVR
ncbi:MAG: hypothetical protein H6739_15300 [Alphaproteobacteria bacterium]|nr:hypothetical protein [Alphaproteobacteria bacterium]